MNEGKSIPGSRDGDDGWTEKSGEKGSRLQNVRRSAGFESLPPCKHNSRIWIGTKNLKEPLRTWI